jgi:hypothetical protein
LLLPGKPAGDIYGGFMENVLLVRYGEIHLKGLNRPFFERKLVEGIKHALSDLGATVRMEQGRIFVLGIKDKDRDEAVDRLTRVFGIHSISPAVAVEKEWGAIADRWSSCGAPSGRAEVRPLRLWPAVPISAFQ